MTGLREQIGTKSERKRLTFTTIIDSQASKTASAFEFTAMTEPRRSRGGDLPITVDVFGVSRCGCALGRK